MGIQLPAELAEVAAKAGVAWPQADEDAMRSSATAWREAGAEITRLASASDGTAGKALDALSGQTGDAARAHWNAIVAPDGDLGAAAKGCNAAADRLEHGANQVGAAKVELVRELVNLAKNNDAAQQAASAGHPTALLGLDTAVRGTSANVANLTSTLTNAVRLDSGVDMATAAPPVNANPGAHGTPPVAAAPGAGGGGGLLGGALDGVVGTVTAPVAAVVAPVTAVVTPVVDGVVAPVVETVVTPVVEAVAPVVDAVAAPAVDTVQRVVEPVVDTAEGVLPADVPIPVRDVVGAVDNGLNQFGPAVQWPTEPGVTAPTGPLNVGPVVDVVGAATDEVTTSASAATLLDRPVFPTDAPQAPAQQATQAPAANVGSGAGFGGAPAAAQGLSGAVPPAATGGAAPTSGGGVVAGGSSQGGPQRGAEQAPQKAAQDQPAQKADQNQKADQRGQQQGAVGKDAAASKDAVGKDPKKDESILPFAVVPIRLGGHDTDVRLLPPGPTTSVLPEAPATPGVRPAQTALPDDPATALFLLHMFPSRTLPAPSAEPARQLPPPAADNDYAAGLRFEPQDHPDSALVEADARERPRLVHGPGLGPDHPKVLALAGSYDPQAGMHEREWDSRFLVRAEPPEYAWPPGELFPEGGYEEGQAGLLSEGVELDRFGTPEGRVLSELGTPFARRSLPPSLLAAGYHRYRVLRPLPVWLTLSAEWFGQVGSGVRYRTTYPVADLVALGYLMEINS